MKLPMRCVNKCINITFGKATNVTISINSLINLNHFAGPVVSPATLCGSLDSIPFDKIGVAAANVISKIIAK